MSDMDKTDPRIKSLQHELSQECKKILAVESRLNEKIKNQNDWLNEIDHMMKGNMERKGLLTVVVLLTEKVEALHGRIDKRSKMEMSVLTGVAMLIAKEVWEVVTQ